MPYLEVKTRQGNKRMKLDGSTITVGRLPDNVLQLMDEQASRHHCVIEPWEAGFRVRDLGLAQSAFNCNIACLERDLRPIRLGDSGCLGGRVCSREK